MGATEDDDEADAWRAVSSVFPPISGVAKQDDLVALDYEVSDKKRNGSFKSRENNPSVKKKLIFIHGLGGHSVKSWGNLKKFLKVDRRIDGAYDFDDYGYITTINPLKLITRKHSNIEDAARGLDTSLRYLNCPSVDIICHSLGGVILAQYLIDVEKMKEDGRAPENCPRVEKLVLISSPIKGAAAADWAAALGVAYFHPQIKDLCKDTGTLSVISSEWKNRKIAEKYKVKYITGNNDKIVSPNDSYFDDEKNLLEQIEGADHTSIIKPKAVGDLVVEIIKRHLIG